MTTHAHKIVDAENRSLSIRSAQARDAEQLAEVYWACSAEFSDSFLIRLGKRFVKRYFHIMLREKNSLVLCLEEANGRIVGLVAGSLTASEHLDYLRDNRIGLLLVALPAIISDPKLIRALYKRQQSNSALDSEQGYVVLSGCRMEFWGLLPHARSGSNGMVLLKTWVSVAYSLGATEIWFEVESEKKAVRRLHRALGAQLVKEYMTPDGHSRVIMKYTKKDK